VGETLLRRIRTIPILFLLAAVVWVLFVPLVIVAMVVDLGRWLPRRTPWMGTRLVAFLLAYLTAEVIGVIALGSVWIGAGFGSHHDRLRRHTYTIQRLWAEAIFWAARAIFRLQVTAQGAELASRPPFVVFARHTSIVDNLLHTHLVSNPYRIHLRYVMKAELLVDPAIDVAGNRLPNAFVKRGADDSEGAIESVRRLTEDAGPDEGVLIYPEGTRFSPAKLERALRRLERRNPAVHAKAVGFHHLLPPRLGGPLAMLSASSADVVFMAHHGLGGFARIADIWSGAMVGRRITVEYWRVPRSEIPTTRSGRVDWLFEWWHRIDDWVADKEAK